MEENKKKYLLALREKYPTKLSAKIRIIELSSELNLPKGTEHFMSDLHGEAEAFLHIRRSASGVIKNKIRKIFEARMSGDEMAELATVIYYPEEKLKALRGERSEEWYRATIYKIVEILRKVGERYHIREFERRIVGRVFGFEAIIMQIVWGDNSPDVFSRSAYLKNLASLDCAEELICALSAAVRLLVVDRLHIIGDIFDRGARPDLIIDALMDERVDVAWGNHDVLWMGAVAGSVASIAAVMSTSLNYGNLDVLELGYGISLRPLAEFAESVYGSLDCSHFLPRGENLNSRDKKLIAKINKAMAVIRFKTEGEVILRNPDFLMDDRLILGTFDKRRGTVKISDTEYGLADKELPTLDVNDPYRLTADEARLMDYYKSAFTESRRLKKHISFLYRVGAIYRIYNGNLLFHGCVPMKENGELLALPASGGLSGRGLMDFCDKVAREGYFSEVGSDKKQRGEDFLWFLGCGKNSPLLGREKIATFERFFLSDKSIKKEPKNPYYKLAWESLEVAEMILDEFGLYGDTSHIINGHIPQNRGENPIKADGKLIVIDGGFCSAYHSVTGIAGYTLIYNAEGMRLSAHAPFVGREDAVKNNGDIISEAEIFETRERKIRIRETDQGKEIREEICDLVLLLEAYEKGMISEKI